MKKLIWSNLLVVLMSFALSSVTTALASTPDNIIASASKRLLLTLNQERAHFERNPQRMYNQVTSLMRPIADFRSISKGVMGSFYKTANEDQKSRFATVFEQSLVRIFSNALMKSKVTRIDVISTDNDNPNSNKKQTSVVVATSDGDRFPISFSMVRNAHNKWLIRNVVLDGINLGLTYRNQFESEMNRSGNNINHVIANWSKVAKQ